MKSDIKLGASIAISWAWGTSLILGMQIAQQKGIEAFAVWAIANSLTLAVFGWLYRKGVLTERVLKYKAVHWTMLVIQCFCLVIQLKILQDVLTPCLGGDTYWVVSLIGAFFVAIMYKHGLSTSIWTDNWQGAITMLALVSMLGISLATDAANIMLPHSDSNAMLWAGWSACILMSGIITDLQHWQRAKVDNGQAFNFATWFFAAYMVLVFALAHFQLSGACAVLLVLAVLGVTTSTIDSIAVAMHRAGNRNYGTGICLAICVLWTTLIDYGVIDIWSYFGVVRVGLAATMLYLALRRA